MTYHQKVAGMLRLARIVTSENIAAIDRLSIEGDSLASRDNPEDLYDQTILAFLLTGLMDRARRSGVPWEAVVADADEVMRDFGDIPLTEMIQ